LFAVGALMERLYERSLHAEALVSFERLTALHESLARPTSTGNLLDLYRLNQGPIATTLDNRREAFLPVGPEVPGRNVYPTDASRDEIESFLAANPERRAEVLSERSVVRRAPPATPAAA